MKMNFVVGFGGSPLLQQGELDFSPAKKRGIAILRLTAGRLIFGGSPLLQQRELDFSPAKTCTQRNRALALGFIDAIPPTEPNEQAE
jgi:hypothetical protein